MNDEQAPKPDLPCPFCGSADRLLHTTTGNGNGFGWALVRCLRCGAEGPRDAAHGMGWNTRNQLSTAP